MLIEFKYFIYFAISTCQSIELNHIQLSFAFYMFVILWKAIQRKFAENNGKRWDNEQCIYNLHPPSVPKSNWIVNPFVYYILNV